MSERAKTVRELFERGESYAAMCRALDVGMRQLRRLLAAAGIERPAGRPLVHPEGKRISLAATGLF